MFHKDYKKIAAIFANAKKSSVLDQGTILALQADFASMLKEDNHRFQADKFHEACQAR